MNALSVPTLPLDQPSIDRPLTRVLLTFIPERVNVWLRFGQPVRERFIDRHRREVDFMPRQTIGLVQWQGNVYGTTQWRFNVLQTVDHQEAAQRIIGVAPGAEILLRVSGTAKVQHVLALIDAMETQGINASDVSAAYWRVAHNRYAAHMEPPPYDRAVHAAYRRRQVLELE